MKRILSIFAVILMLPLVLVAANECPQTTDEAVSASGKRLTPTTLTGTCGQNCVDSYQESSVGPTSEVLQDDGTYGSSAEYIYWWDTRGVYHQHYISGGQIVHVSSQPLAVRHVLINMEVQQPSTP